MSRRYVPLAFIAVVIVFLPTTYGVVAMGSTELRDPYDQFELSLSNFLPLLYPLLLALLYAPIVVRESAGYYTSPAQARLGRRRYVLGHVTSAAVIGFATMALSIAIAWIVAMYIAPHMGTTYVPQADSLDPSERTTFGQLIGISPLLYVAFYSLWVGLHGALYTSAAAICVWLIPNRIVALATPMIIVFVLDFALAVIGLERWTLTGAAFPGNMDQGPLWIPLIVTILLTCTVGFTLRKSLRRDIVPPGLA